MKKSVSIMMAAALTAGLLSGCQGTTKNETDPAVSAAQEQSRQTAAPSEGQETKTAEESKEAGGETVTINVWHSMEGNNGNAFGVMIDNFNATRGKELGIVANNVFQGNDTAVKLKTLLQTNDVANLPDVCMVYGASLPVVATSAYCVPVEDMYGTGSLDKNELNAATIQTYTYMGKQYCMPFNSSTLLLYYNTDAFAEAGLDPANPPRTFDEIAAACEKLTKTENGVVTRYGFNSVLDRYQMVNLIGNQGTGSYFGDNEGGRTGLMTQVVAGEQIEKIYEGWSKIAATGGLKYNYDNQNEEFATGMNAMTMMSSARITSVTNLTKESGVNWAVAKLPGMSLEDKGGACIGGASLAMFDAGDEARKKAAWEFIQYTAEAQTQADWSIATGYLPVNLKTKEIPAYADYVKENEAVAVALDQFESSNPMVQEPVMMMQSNVDSVIKEASINVAEGVMNPGEAAAFVVTECNKLFEEYNKANQ